MTELDSNYILSKGWYLENPSPNGHAYTFFKGEYSNKKWCLMFYKSDIYFTPLKIRYYCKEDGHVLGTYDHWTDEFEFHCKTPEEFDLLMKMLNI